VLTLGRIAGDGSGNAQADTGAVVAALGSRAVVEVAEDPGLYYAASDHGAVLLDDTPDANSAFAYLDASRPGIFTFDAPGSLVSAPIYGLGPGDSIELPGTAIGGVSFGADSVTITSNTGTFAFDQVSFASSLTGATAAIDPRTGLMEVTFEGYTRFSETNPAGGPFFWSNSANWSNGLPTDGWGAIISTAGVDDIAALQLAGLIADDGTALTVEEDLSLALLQANGGTVTLAAATGTTRLLAVGSISGGGTLSADGLGASVEIGADGGAHYILDDGGTLVFDGVAGIGSEIAFDGASTGDTLALRDPGSTIDAALVGLADGDRLELPGTAITGVTLGASALTVTTDLGTYVFENVTYGTLPGGYRTGFDAARDLASLTFAPPCFAAGTMILTPAGEVPVEVLRPGLAVMTGDGPWRPIRWIGRRHVDCLRHPDPGRVRPIRINTHAFGPSLPNRDLFLSPDHALYSGGVLIPVKHLVDGLAVRQEEPAEVTYFHIELETHEILLANGLPVESFLDTGNRIAFTNGGPVAQLYADFDPLQASMVREAKAYAPLEVMGPEVVRLRQILYHQGRRFGRGRRSFG
jgi:hypothetical protein